MMKISITLFAAALLSASVFAQEADKPADTQAQATKLSKDELQSFIPGTKVHHVIQSGSSRTWTNEPDGKFVASTDSKKYSMTGAGSTGHGSWRISDDGKYCIEIDWKRDSEKWCSFVWRTEKGYALGADGPKKPIEFSK
ncbi:MAG: DUF995 domain-containing protein [Rhodocyclaceae bacterium]